MTLPASAIINGLTMLRAYNAGITVTTPSDSDAHATDASIVVYGVTLNDLHAEDYRRMQAEGWVWSDASGRWEL